MAVLKIRNLDETVKRRLQTRAARHGRSVEAEARAILAASGLAITPAEDLTDAARKVIALAKQAHA